VAVPLREPSFNRFSGELGRDTSTVSFVGLNKMVLVEVLRACPGLTILLGDILALVSDGEDALAGVRAGVLGLVTIGVRKNSSSDVT
jgi:hypothetical protein